MNQQVEADSINQHLQTAFISQHPTTAVWQLEALPISDAVDCLTPIPIEQSKAVWEQLPADVAISILLHMEHKQVIAILTSVSAKTAARLISQLPKPHQASWLDYLNANHKAVIQELLAYSEDSVGYLMDPKVVALKNNVTVEQAETRLRASQLKGIQNLFIVNDHHELEARVDLQDLTLAQPQTTLGHLAKPLSAVIQDTEPQDNVSDLFKTQQLMDVPVVDYNYQLVGVLPVSTVAEIHEQTASLPLHTMVGVSRDERALSSAVTAVTKRLPWLEINLVTAFLAAATVGLFEHVIAKHVTLAVLLPVVAGQSGNTGAQSLAVTLRGLSVREIRMHHWLQMLVKEAGAALVSGIVVALTCALAVGVWSQSVLMAAIIAMSMVISMVLAGIAGTLTPMFLQRIGLDPAQSSTIILTTITDVTGFFSFLGIAMLLLPL